MVGPERRHRFRHPADGALLLALLLSALSAGCAPQLSPAVVAHATEAAGLVECDRVHTGVDDLVDAMDGEELDHAVWEEHGLPHRRQAAFDWIVAELDGLGVAYNVESIADRHVAVDNIVVTLPSGTGPGNAPTSETIQLSAHYDTWFTGADDNASGVSTAMEALRVLHDMDRSRTIQVLFYDMEETGLDGSLAWWEKHPNAPVQAVVNLDAIAFTGSQTAPPGFRIPKNGDYIVGLANGPAKHHLRWMAELSTEISGSARMFGVQGVGRNELPAATDFHRSDHAPAWQKDVPAVFVTDTANLRNPHYHQESDLPETLDRAFHCAVSRLTVASVAAFAEAP